MIEPTTLVWNAMNWLAVSAVAGGVLVVLLIVGYLRAGSGMVSAGVRVVAASLKILAIVILAVCLLEPLFSGQRARPGAKLTPGRSETPRGRCPRDRRPPARSFRHVGCTT